MKTPGFSASFQILVLAILLTSARRSVADDWVTFRHDQKRSGQTEEQLVVNELTPKWIWQSPAPPKSAWPDSARWDAYAKLDGLKSMREYDLVFHPIVVGDSLLFGSNVDDSVRSLSLETGKLNWQFTAGGPVRVAPVAHESTIYFGSDDGSIYALNVKSGALMWRHKVEANASRFVNDGRLCSFQPVRSGILVDAKRECLVAASGIFPWKDSHFVCLSLATGEVQWKKDLGTGWTLEGPMLMSSNRIISPQGRAPPQVFDLENGNSLGALPGGGGSLAVVDENDNVFHGPGNKAGWITGSKLESREKLATIENGRSIVVQSTRMFVLESDSVYALDRGTGETLWRNSLKNGLEVILAGSTLFVAAGENILALDNDTGDLQWGAEVSGKIYGLAVANGCLVTSTDKGEITVFSADGESPISSIALEQLAESCGLKSQSAEGFEIAKGSANTPPISSDPTLLERWVFHANQVDGEGQEATLKTLAIEGTPLPLNASAKFRSFAGEHAWELDGNQDSEARADFRAGRYPKVALSAVATVRIDKGQPWGGLLAISQDNGAYEKGWILGFRNRKMGFAVNGMEGPDRLTWITDKRDFEEGDWHHVVGTYDGKLSRLYVDGELVAENNQQSGDIDYPQQSGFQVASYKDRDEHFYTSGMLNEAALYNRALTAAEVSRLFIERQDKLGGRIGRSSEQEENSLPKPYTVQDTEGRFTNFRGPRFRFDSPGKASVFWSSAKATSLKIVGGQAEANRQQLDSIYGEEIWTITGIDPRESVFFVIEGPSGQESKVYECDGHFDFTEASLAELTDSDTGPNYELRSAFEALYDTLRPRGLALVHGADNRHVAFARDLASESNMRVVLMADTAQGATDLRKQLQNEKIYGRVVVECDTDFDSLPSGVFNLILAKQDTAVAYDRIVKPGGWLIKSDKSEIPLEGFRTEIEKQLTISDQTFNAMQAERTADSAGWTHMYGAADNSAFSGEALGGASQITDLKLTWAGRPGPRYQSDRGNRKPSPLATGGRLFLQGLKRLIALDAHNGTILWAWEMPEMVRFNVPRDCSNWCADEEHVFVAIQDESNVLDAKSGEIVSRYKVVPPTQPPVADRTDWNWGFIARHKEMLLGSCVRKGNVFEGFWGGTFWYDAKDGDLAKKVCSDSLFALEAENGLPIWTYESGLIVNPTISVSDDRIVFLECRSKQLRSSEARMLDGAEFWDNMWLVAINSADGERLWELPAKPMPGTAAVYGVCVNDTFLLQTSNAGEFAVYAFNMQTGKMLWRGKYKWEADHHGKHLSRPAVVNNKIYLRPLTLDLDNGKVLSTKFPAGHQCGTYTASANAIFLRAGNLTMWDGESQAATRWDRVRPDCWISTIPAEGMLLSPEGGGGCSCGGWLETSIGFAPIRK